jgi:hypothetical protein
MTAVRRPPGQGKSSGAGRPCRDLREWKRLPTWRSGAPAPRQAASSRAVPIGACPRPTSIGPAVIGGCARTLYRTTGSTRGEARVAPGAGRSAGRRFRRAPDARLARSCGAPPSSSHLETEADCAFPRGLIAVTSDSIRPGSRVTAVIMTLPKCARTTPPVRLFLQRPRRPRPGADQ